MALILTKIVLSTDSNKSLARVKRVLGDKSYQSLLAKTTKKVNSLAQLALEAYQSKIPIDGGQLRNQNLQLKQATPQTGVAEIFIDGPHTSVKPELARRFGTIKQSEVLAQILDIGSYGKNRLFNRSRPSQATGRYSAVTGTTARWIAKARQAFAQTRRSL